MNKIKIKARLKEDVTEEEFLMATFNEVDEDNIRKFDIYRMKTEPLEGYNYEDEEGIYIYVPYTNEEDDYIIFGYEMGNQDIWEIIE